MSLLSRIRYRAGAALSGALLWFVCMFLFDWATGRGNELSVFSLCTVSLVTPAAFWLLTYGWNRLLRAKSEVGRPAVWILLGIMLVIPVYFEFAANFFRARQSESVAAIIREMLSLYVALPLSILSITTYQMTLPALCLSLLAAIHADAHARPVALIAKPS